MQQADIKNKIYGNPSLKALFDAAVSQYTLDWIEAAGIDFDAIDAECNAEEAPQDDNVVEFISRTEKDLLERVKEIKVSEGIKQYLEVSACINTIALIEQNVAKYSEQSFEIVARRTLSQPLFPQIRHA